MGVYRFEDLRVWQAAKRQCDRVGQLLKQPDLREDHELASQLNWAAISVMNNISEGFIRRRDREMLQYLRYAAASNGEVRACLYAVHGRQYIDDQMLATLVEESNAIGRMLTRFQATITG